MKKAKINFTEKNLTGNAGLYPIGLFVEKIGLIETLKKELTVVQGENHSHPLVKAISIVIIGVIAGCKHFTQLDILKHDKVIRKLFSWEKFPSLSTFGRLFRLFSFKNCVELGNAEAALRKKIWDKKSCESVTCDMDSSVKGVYGKQEGAAKGYNPKKKGQSSYHPLFCFIAENKECLHNWFRTGSAYTSNGCVEFVKECFEKIPSQVKKIFFRADSGFFVGGLLDLLEKKGCFYLIKVKLKNLISLMESQKWESFKTGFWVATFEYKCAGWEKARIFKAVRILVAVDASGLFPIPKYEYFCYVTNRQESPYECHKLYGQRATSENWIEWCKNHMACGCFLTQNFWANAALFQACVLAYNLMVWMTWLTSKSAWREEPNTFRNWFIKAPARLIQYARQYLIKLQKNFFWEKQWTSIYEGIDNLQFVT